MGLYTFLSVSVGDKGSIAEVASTLTESANNKVGYSIIGTLSTSVILS